MKKATALLGVGVSLFLVGLAQSQVVLQNSTSLGFHNVSTTYSSPVSLTMTSAAHSVVFVSLTYYSNDAISAPIVYDLTGANISLTRYAFIGLVSDGTEINSEIWAASVPATSGSKGISLKSESGPINGVGIRAFQVSNADFSTILTASSGSGTGEVGAWLGNRPEGSFGLDILHSVGTGTYTATGTTRTSTVQGVDASKTTVSSYVSNFPGGTMTLSYNTPTVNTVVAGAVISAIPEPATALGVAALVGCAWVVRRKARTA